MSSRAIPNTSSRTALRLSLWLVPLLLTACGDPATLSAPPITIPTAVDAATPEMDAASSFPDSGIGSSTVVVSRVAPDHGPFTGGNAALVRGTGFTADALVTVGGLMVQPADTQLIGPNRLRIILPAGEPGPADVSVIIDGAESSLPGGYTYDQIMVDPDRGAVSGGTVVTLIGSGTSFADGDTLAFGGTPCTDVTVSSETRLTCKVPAAAPGSVDVVLTRALDGTTLTIADGFTYYDSTDPFGGGLGGGALEGDMNISVIDATSGAPVSDAFVIVGEDLSTDHQGLTSLLGQITFSGDDLTGRHTVHVAKHCYEKTSVVAFDARDVTVFLIPWQDPSCGMGSGMPPTGRGRSGAYVSGELIFFGPNELGPNPWDNIPDPREGETKVAYVYTTQRCVGQGSSCRNPDPSIGGAHQRVLETEVGSRGYPYRIFARPAGLAVYALAGLEETATGNFIPYIMGVGRNVLAGPGMEVEGVDMDMNIPLDHVLDVRLTELPGVARTGPDRFVVNGEIDLGGEGVIERIVNGENMDVARGRDSENLFRLFAQPALLGALADGRYRVAASWETGDYGSDPSTHVVVSGVRAADAELVVGDFLGIPQASSPAFGERLPDDRMLRWETDGPDPDLHMILMIGGDGNPAWRQFVPGNVHESPIPDLSSIPEIDDIATGFITWVVYAIRIPGFNYDELSYTFLQNRFWSAWAIDVFTAQR
ncbi:MAG: hypothetical protein GXP55_22760 [Deltaproteobacteria bacterium]|nr:hypothetical protein [Deltaproteobacteria bacterium]